MDLLKLNLLHTLVDNSEHSGQDHYDAVVAVLQELFREDATVEGVFNAIAENYTTTYDWDN